MSKANTKHMDFSEMEKSELNGFFGIIPESIRPWTPEKFRKIFSDKSKWPIFTLRTYSGIDQMMETDHISVVSKGKEGEDPKVKISSAEMIIYRLQRCIVGCKNFFDVNGDEVEFSSEKSRDGAEVATRSFIERIPYFLQMDLFKAITESISLSEEDKMGLDS